MLVVIAVISLLASVIIVGVNSARIKARNARRVADIQQLAKALELFYNTCGSYPALPAATTGIKIDNTQALFSGTASQCGSADMVNGANGVLPNGGIGAKHAEFAGETMFVPAFGAIPTPIDDGSLTAGNRCSENNSQTGYKWGEYSYVSFAPSSPSQYWVYFCISSATGTLQAGRYILTERGIIQYAGNLFP